MRAERLRNRLIYRPLDAVLTSSLRGAKKRREHLQGLFSLVSKGSDRIASLVCLVDRLFPGAARRAQAALFRPAGIPFYCDRMELLGAGSGAAVFLVEAGGRRYVLKTYRRTIGRGRMSLRDMAYRFRGKFRTVNSWYAGPHDLVVPAFFFVFRGPLLGRKAVGCLQPFVEGEMRDLLGDFTDQQLITMAEADPAFGEALRFFARRSLEVRSRQGLCIDVLGSQNLVLLRQRGAWKIKLIDYGIFDFRVGAPSARNALLRSEKVLARLQLLLEDLEKSWKTR